MNKTLEETLRIFVQGKEAPAGRGRKQLTMFEFVLYGEVQHTPASLIHGPQPRCPSATVFAEGLMSSQLAARDAIQQANRLFRERHTQAQAHLL